MNGIALPPVIKLAPGSRALVAATLRCILLITLAMHFIGTAAPASKPRVWICSDMSDKGLPGSKAERTVNDPDDISAMAGYLLMANECETLGIVVTSTHRSQHRTSPDQGAWANAFLGNAYLAEVGNLNRHIGGYPADLKFAHNSVDHSDSATYWTLLGNWGVSLKDIAANGTNDPEVERRNEKTFLEWSPRIHDELLRRTWAAAPDSE